LKKGEKNRKGTYPQRYRETPATGGPRETADSLSHSFVQKKTTHRGEDAKAPTK